jgi:hypothetical protein
MSGEALRRGSPHALWRVLALATAAAFVLAAIFAEPVAVAVSCDIKGNIALDDERIYHLPGQTSYAATRIDLLRGERWFCSENDARAAGWRRAKL